MYGSLDAANVSLRNNAKLRRGSGSFFRREIDVPKRAFSVREPASPSAARRAELRRSLRSEKRKSVLKLLLSVLLTPVVLLACYFFPWELLHQLSFEW